MLGFLQPLFLLLAKSTGDDLARMVEYLKAENRILRDRLPKRIAVTPVERRRLVKLGKPLGAAIAGLVTIVSPRTFTRWINGDDVAKPAKTTTRKPGRPKTQEEIRALIVRLGKENGWGYTRILGELKKLGVGKVSRSTVVNILKENGFDPGPKRGAGTWDEFVKRHAATLWACDFLSKKVWTLGGAVDVFVLFFIHVGTRRVYVSGMTPNPDKAWMTQQARNVSMHFAEQKQAPTHLLLDHDSKFVAEFDAILESDGVELKRVGPRAPNMNALAERWAQSIKHECLNHFVVFGEAHLRHIVSEYVRYYNESRPHQGLGNRTLSAAEHSSDADPLLDDPISMGAIQCDERLGGLLKNCLGSA
jgi:putative transposase